MATISKKGIVKAKKKGKAVITAKAGKWRGNPPTYANVGTSDGIANYQTMQNRIQRIRAQGTDAEIEVFSGLPHGYGLGIGTAAEGWTSRAVSFWERQMQ